jgi:3-hydroxy-9,10-secoandrosta-1,3,5(10)-triene-9,17-dione monooxygenase
MAEAGLADEIVAEVGELAAVDGSDGWLAASFKSAAYEVAQKSPDAHNSLVARAFHGTGALNRRTGLSGRWELVVGAQQAAWLLLPVARGRHVLVPQAAVVLEPVTGLTGLHEAGIRDVTATGVGSDVCHVVECGPAGRVLGQAAAAAAVVGSAEGVLRMHVEQVRARLATSHGGDEVTDAAAAQVAWSASDIDAARIQVAGSVACDLATATWAHQQAVARARDAADRLIANSRHALNASDQVTGLWRDVHAGCRLATRLFGAERPAGSLAADVTQAHSARQ